MWGLLFLQYFSLVTRCWIIRNSKSSSSSDEENSPPDSDNDSNGSFDKKLDQFQKEQEEREELEREELEELKKGEFGEGHHINEVYINGDHCELEESEFDAIKDFVNNKWENIEERTEALGVILSDYQKKINREPKFRFSKFLDDAKRGSPIEPKMSERDQLVRIALLEILRCSNSGFRNDNWQEYKMQSSWRKGERNGIPNYGNTCYIAAALQLLSSIGIDLNKEIDLDGWLESFFKHINGEEELDEEILEIGIEEIKSSIFGKVGSEQQDASEFLGTILEKFNGPIPIEDTITIRCSHCGEAVIKYEKHNILPLTIAGKSVSDCLGQYCKKENIEDYTCKACGKQGATKQHEIEIPGIDFSLSFKIFDKNLLKQSFPDGFKIGKVKINDSYYTPSGIIVHRGEDLHAGHYVFYGLNEDGSIYEINDAEVTCKIDPNEIFRDPTTDPYVVLYKMVEEDEGVEPVINREKKEEINLETPFSFFETNEKELNIENKKEPLICTLFNEHGEWEHTYSEFLRGINISSECFDIRNAIEEINNYFSLIPKEKKTEIVQELNRNYCYSEEEIENAYKAILFTEALLPYCIHILGLGAVDKCKGCAELLEKHGECFDSYKGIGNALLNFFCNSTSR